MPALPGLAPAGESPFFASPKKGDRKKGEPDSSTLRCAPGTLRCSARSGCAQTRCAQTCAPLDPPGPALLASSLRRGKPNTENHKDAPRRVLANTRIVLLAQGN